MYKSFHYYLLDNVSETILGQFYAKSERMARKMMEGFDFKKANLSPVDVSLVCYQESNDCFETYDEIIRSEKFNEVNLPQLEFDFSEDKDDA